jgi:hypothetical protein
LVIDTFIIYESIGGSGSTLSGVVGFVTLVCPSPETKESTATLSSRSSFMTKLERTMNTYSLKHKDVVVNLSSGNAANVSVFNLKEN